MWPPIGQMKAEVEIKLDRNFFATDQRPIGFFFLKQQEMSKLPITVWPCLLDGLEDGAWSCSVAAERTYLSLHDPRKRRWAKRGEEFGSPFFVLKI